MTTRPKSVLRKRKGLSQGVLGARAFDTSNASGRTKIKNIELGRQIPTRTDLEKMAAVLRVHVNQLDPLATEGGDRPPESRLRLNRKLLEDLQGIDVYFDLLNKAAVLNDSDLLGHLSGKLAVLFRRFADLIEREKGGGA